MNPHTFLRAIGPEPWKVAYIEPCRRPTDGRYAQNPNRLQHYYQYQVLMKPSPATFKSVTCARWRCWGFTPKTRRPVCRRQLGIANPWGLGVGWEVWLDGMEVTQFTYFQQCGGIDCRPVSIEITYGIERLAMYLQGVDSIFDIEWGAGLTYGQVHREGEIENCIYNFEQANPELLLTLFKLYEQEAAALSERQLVLPALDYVLKCSHTFNLLDARGVIAVTERTGYIGRIRHLARRIAQTYAKQRESLGFPLLSKT